MIIYSRSKAGEGDDAAPVPLDSLMLFRRGDGNRTKNVCYNGSNECNKIYLVEWGDFIKPTGQETPVGPVSSYSRNEKYVNWSE